MTTTGARSGSGGDVDSFEGNPKLVFAKGLVRCGFSQEERGRDRQTDRQRDRQTETERDRSRPGRIERFY
jgi:hypothetical protein